MPTTDTPSLLTRCERTLTAWTDWQPTTSIADGHGRLAIRATHPSGEYLIAAKRERHGEGVSFMERVVTAAEREERTLVCMVGEPSLSTAWAFSPTTVRSRGERIQIVSKRGVEVPAWDIACRHGALLGDVVSGRASVERGLGRYV